MSMQPTMILFHTYIHYYLFKNFQLFYQLALQIKKKKTKSRYKNLGIQKFHYYKSI